MLRVLLAALAVVALLALVGQDLRDALWPAPPTPAVEGPAKPGAPPPAEPKTAAAKPGEPAAPGGDKAAKGPAPSEKPRLRLPYAKATDPLPSESPPVQEPKEQPKIKRFYRVVVADAGTLKSGETTIRIADLEALDEDARCDAADGKAWPCGRMGRAALARLIRARAVDCAVAREDDGDAKEVSAQCTVGWIDIGEWLVRHGWARPGKAAAKRYAQELDAAQKARAGLWRHHTPPGAGGAQGSQAKSAN